MQADTLILIRSDPRLNMYLKYNSYWYKELIRNPASITLLEEEMKKEIKLTTSDKINDMTEKLEMLQMFLNVMK